MRARQRLHDARSSLARDLSGLAQAAGGALRSAGAIIGASAALAGRHVGVRLHLAERGAKRALGRAGAEIGEYLEEEAPWLMDFVRQARAEPRAAWAIVRPWAIGVSIWLGLMAAVLYISLFAMMVAGFGLIAGAGLIVYGAWRGVREVRKIGVGAIIARVRRQLISAFEAARAWVAGHVRAH